MTACFPPLPSKGGVGGGWRAKRALDIGGKPRALICMIAPTPSPSLGTEGLI